MAASAAVGRVVAVDAGRIVVEVVQDVPRVALLAGDRLIVEDGRVRLVRMLPGFDGVIAGLAADGVIDCLPHAAVWVPPRSRAGAIRLLP